MNKNVDRALRHKLGGDDRVHIHTTDEPVGEKENVDVPACSDGKGAKVVDGNVGTEVIGQRRRESRETNCPARGLACLAPEVVSNPPPRAHLRAGLTHQ